MGSVVCGVGQSVIGGTILLGGDIGWPSTGVPKGEMRTAANPKPQCWKQNFVMVHYSKCNFFQLCKTCQRMAINIVTVLLFLVEYFFRKTTSSLHYLNSFQS